MTIVKAAEQAASERGREQIPPKFSYFSARTTRCDVKEDSRLNSNRRVELNLISYICNNLSINIQDMLGKWPNWRTILFYVFISILYMFRATSCSSSGESILSVQYLVYVTLRRWPFGVQVGKELSELQVGHLPRIITRCAVNKMQNTRHCTNYLHGLCH